MPISPARTAAFDMLLRVERESSYASELLNSAAYDRLSRTDHGLATELVMGVLRWRSLLDGHIAATSSQALAKLDLEILVALRLAVYQFGWLDRIPRRAALHESVELVKRAHKRSAAGFVNAILRKLSTTKPTRALEIQNLSVDTLARNYAHPLWIVERWGSEYGLPAAQQICEYNQSVPTTALRLRPSAAQDTLASEQVTLELGSILATARRVAAGDVTNSPSFRSKQIVIQDEASQLVAALVGTGLPHGTRLLDCCAAPGGKTLAIADSNPGASISAVELHPHRARLLQSLLKVAASPAEIEVITADVRKLPASSAFDRVLADVPCTGTGTLARNPEIKWRLALEDLFDLPQRQLAILRSALAQVRPGGRVIYSTCSLEREENESVVEQVLASDRSCRLLDSETELDRLKRDGLLVWPDADSLTRGPYLRTIPGKHPCDGFFAAILEKMSEQN